MSADLWPPLVALSNKQAGLFTRSQALEVGYTPVSFRRCVAARRLAHLGRGLWQLRAAEEGEHRDLHHALLTAGEDAVISHRAAARLHGLWGVDGFPIELSMSRRPRGRMPWSIVHRWAVPPTDRCTVGCILTTTLDRTLLDLVSAVDRVSYACLLEAARRANPEILAALETRLPSAGLTVDDRWAAEVAIADCRARPRPFDSVFEVQFWHRWRSTGLPMPVPQYEVRDRRGRMYLDFAWPERRVAVETQGFETRQDRRAFDQDRVRAARLTALGWQPPLMVSYAQFRDSFFGDVTRAIARLLAEPQRSAG